MNCNRQNEMFPNMSTVNDIDINNNISMFDPNQTMMMPNQQMMGMPQQMGMTMSPVIEPMRERVINRTIVHEVPQVCPFLED